MPGGIEVKQLEVFYGGNKILNGINLIFPPGKVTAIIGPSGMWQDNPSALFKPSK